jgi:hypothetical protein
MKRLKDFILVLVFVIGLSTLQSCDNVADEATDNGIAQTEASDYVNLLGAFTLSTVDEVTSAETITGETSELKSAETYLCLTVTVHDNNTGDFWPRSWTLDFGTENCESFNGYMRRGKINVSLSDWWRHEGSLREVTFEDFYFDDNKLEGVKTILNTGLNDAGNMSFTKKLSGGKISYADGTSMSWDSEKHSELIEGGNTFIFADDVWSVTGSGSGVNIDSKNYTMSITTPLIYKNGCFYPVSGVISIETDGEETKTIDYGNGECDNLISVTIGDVTEEIEL